MSAHTEFHSTTLSDADILVAVKKIASELEQVPEQCRVDVEIMERYTGNPEGLSLSQITRTYLKIEASIEMRYAAC